MATAFAPGKVILSGEHSVVYGQAAITMALNLGVTAHVERIDGPTKLLTFPNDTLLWNAVQEVIPNNGFSISLQSTLPFGKGMGSSAALSIALIRAYHQEIGSTITLEKELMLGLRMERHFHGTPSGIDHTTSAMGTGIYFKKGPPIQIQPVSLPQLQMVILYSGTTGSTKDMVNLVRQTHLQNAQLINDIGRCTEEILNAIHQNDPHTLGHLFNTNHSLLRDLGISTPNLEDIRNHALKNGALGVKISGSGGGGILLALVEDPTPIEQSFVELGIQTFLVHPYNPSEVAK